MAKKPMPFEKSPRDKERPGQREGGKADRAADRKQKGR
jgi:hypothetical protein